MNNSTLKIIAAALCLGTFCATTIAQSAEPEHGSDTTVVEHDSKLFRTDPNYEDHAYDANEQLQIYGGKRQLDERFYPLLFGSRMYPLGELSTGWNLIGSKNRVYPRLMAFGDLRLAYTTNETGKGQVSFVAVRLNADVDFAITATERLHVLFQPFDQNNAFTNYTFQAPAGGQNNHFNKTLNPNLQAAFFEGDLGSIASGITGTYNHLDLPVAAGLMPVIFHNGIWVNDTFTGAAATIPAKNSKLLDISNMDFTAFAGLNRVATAIQAKNDFFDARIYGFNSFIETRGGYIEAGYGYTQDLSTNNQSYHNAALSFTHRVQNILSMSERVIGNFGQSTDAKGNKSANGALFLLETSWMTRKPYTLIPYANLFCGIDKPQGLAKNNGILANTGIIFDGDALTAFPTLENSANNTYGGALGLEYLFNLDQQIVLEAGTVQVLRGPNFANSKEIDDEYGFGFRYQIPLTKEIIFRTDGIYGIRKQQNDIAGVRAELRFKY